MAKNKGGRPSKFTNELVAEICERLSKGEPLAQICRDEQMPHPSTVGDWAKERPDVSLAITRAREDGEEAIALDCLNIADDNGRDTRILDDGRETTEHDVIQRAKLRIDTRMKLLSKWNPKKWGEKTDLTTNGKDVGPATITIVREIMAARPEGE